MTEDTNVYRNERYSCVTLVAIDQNVKTYPTTQCKFLLKGKATLEQNIIKMKDILFPNISVQVS